MKNRLVRCYGFYSTGKPGLCAPNPEWKPRPTLPSRKGRPPEGVGELTQ